MARQRYTTMQNAENSAHRSYGTAGRRDGAGIEESLGFKYEPYGKIYATSGFFLNQLFVQDRFTGHEWDYETSMYWAPYRNYRPDMLRWISRDPLGMADGPNVYGYVRGKVITSKDTFGLFLDWMIPYGPPQNPFAPPQAYQRPNLSSLCGCDGAPPLPASSGVCSIYGPNDTFAYYGARCVCENAGDSPWDMAVRGCLACAKGKGLDSYSAHVSCYIAADIKTGGGGASRLDIGIRLTHVCLGNNY